MPRTKLSILLDHMRGGDWVRALSLASKFHDLGEHKEAITRGHNAAVRPEFYRQIRRNPEADFAAGVEALKARYPYWTEAAK